MTVANPRPALRTYLLADAAISAQVSAQHIYPQIVPQDVTGDSIAFTRISGRGDHHMQGASGLAQTRIQINAWSLNADDASTLADLVKTRIGGFKGEIEYSDDSPANTLIVQGIFFADERELYDDTRKMFGMSRDYFVWYAER